MPLNKDLILLYRGLSKLEPEELSHIIQHLNDNCIENVCEGVYNTIYTNLKIPKIKKKKLKSALSEEKTIKNIKKITKKRLNSKTKRRALIQEGKGLKTILSVLTPIVSNLVKKQ